MPNFWTVMDRDLLENIQITETYTNDATQCSGLFFPENAIDHGSASWMILSS